MLEEIKVKIKEKYVKIGRDTIIVDRKKKNF